MWGPLYRGLCVFDPGTINLSQIIFSINPGLWVELFYRGVMMALLLRDTKSVKQSAIIQVLLFSIFYVKGFEFWSLVDVFSVSLLAVGFTYSAYKTRTLIPGIIFHFLHDAFVFVMQVSSSVPLNNTQNATFFISLWVAVGIGVLVTKISAENLEYKQKKSYTK
jgi:membrane protease YdiL (CAAX protease family)